MSVETIVEAVHRYRCDKCGTTAEVSFDIEPISDWIYVSVQAVRSRPGESFNTMPKNLCGSCASETGLRR